MIKSIHKAAEHFADFIVILFIQKLLAGMWTSCEGKVEVDVITVESFTRLKSNSCMEKEEK